MSDWDPYRRWMIDATVYSVSGPDYYFRCFDCYNFMHQHVVPGEASEKGGYNILLANIPLLAKGNADAIGTEVVLQYM